MLQVYCGHHDVNLPTRSLWFPCQCVHVHCLTVLGDGPCVVPMAHLGRSTGAPCPLWTPRRPSFHPLDTIKPWTRHSRGAKVWHLPHNDLPWRSKPGHTMEIQAGSHNGDPKTVHIMEIQASPHNGDPSRSTQWRSKAGSHNGDPSQFIQWRSKPVHTMEIQAGSQNRDPRRSTQWRSKAVHTLHLAG